MSKRLIGFWVAYTLSVLAMSGARADQAIPAAPATGTSIPVSSAPLSIAPPSTAPVSIGPSTRALASTKLGPGSATPEAGGTVSLGGLRAAEAQGSVADLVASIMPSVVNIYVRGAPPKPKREQDEKNVAYTQKITERLGSGFIVDANGIIVTNKHVVDDAYQIIVTLSNGWNVEARLLGQAIGYDVALIKIDVDMSLKAVRLGNSDKLRVGDQVIAVGNPLGFAGSVSGGLVSALHRDINSSAWDEYIQTDAPINHGNSGGPLFNLRGEAIGLNTAIYTLDGGSIGIGFAIPSNDVKFVLDEVRQYGRIRIGWLGVSGQKVSQDMAEALDLLETHGVIISTVTPNSPAAAAGLREGDIIQKIGEDPIFDVRTLNRAVALAADQTVVLSVWRKTQAENITATIAEWPQPQWKTNMAAARMDVTRQTNMAGELGLRLVPIDDALRAKFKIEKRVIGIVVTDVSPDSIAANAGIKVGDVVCGMQYDDIRTADDFQTVLKTELAKGKRTIVVAVVSDTQKRWVALKVGG